VRSAVDAVEQQRPSEQAQPTTPIVRRTETTTVNLIEDADAGAGADSDAAVAADSSSLLLADAIEKRQPLEVIQAVVQAWPHEMESCYSLHRALNARSLPDVIEYLAGRCPEAHGAIPTPTGGDCCTSRRKSPPCRSSAASCSSTPTP
jgi:hypothetical protein